MGEVIINKPIYFMLEHSKNAWLSGLVGLALNILDKNRSQNKCNVSYRDGVGTVLIVHCHHLILIHLQVKTSSQLLNE